MEDGLADRVTVLNRDYRDLDGTYDKLVSIEMIEAVDWRQHDTFFATCAGLLHDRGLMALQAITVEDRSFERAKNGTDFVARVHLPRRVPPLVGGDRPVAAAGHPAGGGRRRGHRPPLRRDPAPLARQRGRTGPTRSTALGLDDRFQRLWSFYLCYCEGAFLERHISDVQMVMAMPGWQAPMAVRDTGGALTVPPGRLRATHAAHLVGLPEGPDRRPACRRVPRR